MCFPVDIINQLRTKIKKKSRKKIYNEEKNNMKININNL